jgi:2-polyprenyl-6-methoxyphenol hydroxylase-like FAD-dependent oxidoreductase
MNYSTMISRRLLFSATKLTSRSTLTSTSTSSSTLTSTSTTRRIQTPCNYNFSTSTSTFNKKGERLRVAIVGGGAAGLSTALHLAPLVAQGYISGPIDVFEAQETSGREIGVGIWSTALDPFLASKDVESHQLVYQDMTKHGCFVRDVGYRTPKGHWLAKSRVDGENMPDLLFLREMDMLASLRKAVHLEEHRGNVVLHSNSQVEGIYEESTQPWSAPLVLRKGNSTSTESTPRDYHLIVAADGMNSVIRKKYGGHGCQRGRALPGMPSPLDLTPHNLDTVMKESWQMTGQAEATSTQDRDYTVFRGNSHLSRKDIGLDASFQTWGEGRSMRFATVPMLYPIHGRREERQVWFITIHDDNITSEPDPVQRRDKLLEAFGDWHDPICRLVAATPPDEILMERAMAHKHSMSPVVNFSGVVQQMHHHQHRNSNNNNSNNHNIKAPPPSTGKGPAIGFVGDSFMTVDPILAQGYTFGMEGAAALRTSLEASLKSPSKNSYYYNPQLAFDPFVLRNELKSRHDARLSRLIHLLRATELVQALGQPTCGTLSGWISRDILRPLMRFTPGFIKTPLFNFMLKYSLDFSQTPPPTTSEENDKNTKTPTKART